VLSNSQIVEQRRGSMVHILHRDLRLKRGLRYSHVEHTFFLIPEVPRSRHVALALRPISDHVSLDFRRSTIDDLVEHSFLPYYAQTPELSIYLATWPWPFGGRRSMFCVGRSYIVPCPKSSELRSYPNSRSPDTSPATLARWARTRN
jgi:hypothetical protein